MVSLQLQFTVIFTTRNFGVTCSFSVVTVA